jgi:hypothetical protein
VSHCTSIDQATTDEPDVPEECCALAPNKVMTHIEKYDFYVPLPPEVKDNTKHDVPSLASFLQIKEGEVDKGIEWYRKYYPKVLDELIEIMAQYNFGDLKARKSVRNDTKKYKKKFKREPRIALGLTINKGPHVVRFD